MSLYLIESENIYFPQIRGYFKEIVSSYDNGNYRSAMVMLYSTIVCDLLLMLMYGREAQSKTRIASPATIPKSGERNRKIHSCMLYLISI